MHGEKHVLGLYEGATENTTSCIGLLSDLEARGVRTDRAMLFVIDGSKALSKAIRAKFGAPAMIQRCQVHKKRNVEDHLPDEMKRDAGRTISAAHQSGNAARAKRMLEALARQLERKHPSAAASLREGLDEALTVMRLDLDANLARTLSTTNPIEFINDDACRSSSPHCALTTRSSSLRSLTRRGRSRSCQFAATQIQQDSGRSPRVARSSDLPCKANGRKLPAARIVEVVARERRTPIGSSRS